MNDADRKAFEDSWKSQNEEFNFHGWVNSADEWTYSSDAEQKGWGLWQAACEWRDSQSGEPVAKVTHNNTNCIGWDPKFNPLTMDDGAPLYTAPPAAQINQQVFNALQNLLESALKYKLEPSDLCVEDAQAALAAATQMRGDA